MRVVERPVALAKAGCRADRFLDVIARQLNGITQRRALRHERGNG